jgi:hypothetical protein
MHLRQLVMFQVGLLHLLLLLLLSPFLSNMCVAGLLMWRHVKAELAGCPGSTVPVSKLTVDG